VNGNTLQILIIYIVGQVYSFDIIFILFLLAIGITNLKDIINRFNDCMGKRSGIMLFDKTFIHPFFLYRFFTLGFLTSNAMFYVGRTEKGLTSDLNCFINTVISVELNMIKYVYVYL
jgi:hypothetical protein